MWNCQRYIMYIWTRYISENSNEKNSSLGHMWMLQVDLSCGPMIPHQLVPTVACWAAISFSLRKASCAGSIKKGEIFFLGGTRHKIPHVSKETSHQYKKTPIAERVVKPTGKNFRHKEIGFGNIWNYHDVSENSQSRSILLHYTYNSPKACPNQPWPNP